MPTHPLPPRVEHVILDAGGPLNAVLPAHIPGEPYVDQTTMTQLVNIGAVYATDIPPPMDKKGVDRALRPKRVAHQDRALPNGAYVRVHVHPNRFPAAVAADWARRIIDRGHGWVAVDKPPGVPAGPALDNATECATARVAMALQRLETNRDDVETYTEEGFSWYMGAVGGAETNVHALTTTHRLDVATSGVLVLARNSTFAANFNDALRHKRVTKTYECVTEHAVPVGSLEHWTEELKGSVPRRFAMNELRPEDRSRLLRRQTSHGDDEIEIHAGGTKTGTAADDDAFVTPDGRKLCVLRVLSCEETTLGNEASSSSYLGLGKRFFANKIELVTGRTHQIRAQLAAIGCPILGDVLYGGVDLSDTPGGGTVPRVLRADDRLCLHASEMKTEADSALGPVGTILRAGPPWWRA